MCMKDYNYYKTIADICNELNDVYKKFNVQNIIPLGRVPLNQEPDQGNRFILESCENKYLMVETDTSFTWVGTRLYLYEINSLEVNVAKYLHDYDQEDHNNERHKLFVFLYIEGESLKDYLKRINETESYNLGFEFGETLKKVHLLTVNVQKHHIPHWNGKYKWVLKHIIDEYIPNKVTEKAFNYYNDNKDIIEKRYSSGEYYHKENGNYVYKENGDCKKEKVLAFIFDDIKLESLVVANNKVYIDCPINIRIGDPFYDFKYLSLIALENEAFANGIVDGYCDKVFLPNFFEMLKYYTSELIIKEFGKALDEKTIDKLYDAYDDFNSIVPKWYKKKV